MQRVRAMWRLGFVLLAFGIASAAPNSTGSVTFHQDVEPLLQAHCQSCHRAGEIGPMPLLTYDQARPWAKAIREAVLTKRMPPWFADPNHGRYSNDRSLSQAEIETLVKWADSGAPEGDPQKAPQPIEFADGWRIGEPDVVFEMPKEFHVPADGEIDYQWIMIPTGFTEDKWVQAAEFRPGNPEVVHHSSVYTREPDSDYARNYPMGEFFVYKGDGRSASPDSRKGRTMFSRPDHPLHLQVWVPGGDPPQLEEGQARLIKAGSDIIFLMHYDASGKPATDRSKIGLIFAKEPPRERVKTVRIQNGKPIRIAPGESNYRIESRVELQKEVSVVSLQPHMHYRGKSFEYSVIYPNGQSEVLLNVPRYDFYWQLSYYLEKPKILPKGTILIARAVWDNSANNRNNPDPDATVKGGDQSWDEMMAGFMEVAFEPGTSQDFFLDAPLPDSSTPAGEE